MWLPLLDQETVTVRTSGFRNLNLSSPSQVHKSRTVQPQILYFKKNLVTYQSTLKTFDSTQNNLKLNTSSLNPKTLKPKTWRIWGAQREDEQPSTVSSTGPPSQDPPQKTPKPENWFLGPRVRLGTWESYLMSKATVMEMNIEASRLRAAEFGIYWVSD